MNHSSPSPASFARARHALWTGLAVAGALILATALRLYGIANESLWLDEATSLMLARMDIPSLVQWTALDIHPPLFYILLHYWRHLGEGEAMLRGLSVLAGVLNVLVIYQLGETLFDRRTGLYAAVLLAVAPFAIWYAQEVRMYAWVTLLLSASVLLALLSWQMRRWMAWVVYVLVTAGALYTHYYAVFGILLENLFFFYLWFRRRMDRRLLGSWLTSQLAVFVLFLPWFPTFLLPITVGGGGWLALGMGRPSWAVLAQTAVLYMVGTGRELYPALVRRLGYALFVGLLVAGLWPRSARWRYAVGDTGLSTAPLYDENEATAFCLAYLVLPLGIAWVSSQIFKPMYSARYMLPFLIPFLLLVARGVRNIPWGVVRGALMVALVGLMAVGVVAQARLVEKPDWRGLAARITAQARPGDLVLFMPGWHAKPFDYYAQGRVALYSDVPIPVQNYGAEAIAAVERAIAGHPRVWFIWETDHYTDAKGAVYDYLRTHCRQVTEQAFPAVGRVILFENSAALSGS
jgi:mannosyltransferase